MYKKSRNSHKIDKKMEPEHDAQRTAKIHEVFTEATSQLKLAKRKLKEFIIHKNKNKIKLDATPTEHLKILIKLWNNNKDVNNQYYFDMKKHTTQINGQIKDEALKILWHNYLETICGARCVLLEFNHLVN